ncbi:MAG: hypothetical protein V4754_21205 [Pseudomonadota bacterium]
MNGFSIDAATSNAWCGAGQPGARVARRQAQQVQQVRQVRLRALLHDGPKQNPGRGAASAADTGVDQRFPTLSKTVYLELAKLIHHPKRYGSGNTDRRDQAAGCAISRTR